MSKMRVMSDALNEVANCELRTSWTPSMQRTSCDGLIR